MKNLNIKISLATVSLMGLISAANAGIPLDLPEPGIFGLFAGAVAVTIILTRIVRKK